MSFIITENCIDYIVGDNQTNREKLEDGGFPRRVYEAREKVGRLRYDTPKVELAWDAATLLNDENGIKRSIHPDKINNTYERPDHLDCPTQWFHEKYCPYYYFRSLKRHYDELGQQLFTAHDMIFEIWDRLDHSVDLLWIYPHMISDMYSLKPIPDELWEMRTIDVYAKYERVEKEIEEINIKSWGLEKYN